MLLILINLQKIKLLNHIILYLEKVIKKIKTFTIKLKKLFSLRELSGCFPKRISKNL